MEGTDFNRLITQLLAQQQQTERTNALLATVVDTQEQMLSRLERNETIQEKILGRVERNETIQEQMLSRLERNETIQEQMLSRLERNETIQEKILGRVEKLEEQGDRMSRIQETLINVQNKMLTQLEVIYTEQQRINTAQQKFNEQQIRFNNRQEETDAILLSEIREIRTDLRELKKVVLTDHEERLRRLEEFMRRAS